MDPPEYIFVSVGLFLAFLLATVIVSSVWFEVVPIINSAWRYAGDQWRKQTKRRRKN